MNYNNINKKNGEEALKETGYIKKSENDDERIYQSALYTLRFKKQFFTYIVEPIEGNPKAKQNPGISYKMLKAITAEINDLINEKYNKNKGQMKTRTTYATNTYNKNIQNTNQTAPIQQTQQTSKPQLDTSRKLCCLECGHVTATPGVIKHNDTLIKVCPKCKSHSFGVYLGEA